MPAPAKLGTSTKFAWLRAGVGMITMSSVSIFTILQFNTAPLMLGKLCSSVSRATLRSVQLFVFDQFLN
jgi:hypothetical protein